MNNLVTFPPELAPLDGQFWTGVNTEAIHAASMAFKKALIERALGAELSHHLGYPPGAEKPLEVDNHRNGASGKTVLTDDGPLRIDIPRDRQGRFEPLLIPKHERRFTGFDDKIVAMYARGMTVREIQGFLAEQYGTEVSPDFISTVTDAVMAEVTAWQSRPLEPMYPVVFLYRSHAPAWEHSQRRSASRSTARYPQPPDYSDRRSGPGCVSTRSVGTMRSFRATGASPSASVLKRACLPCWCGLHPQQG